MGVPYALAPVEPHQGQCIYVPRWVSRILRKEKNCVFTFVGIRWLKRPKWLILRWLADAKELQETAISDPSAEDP